MEMLVRIDTIDLDLIKLMKKKQIVMVYMWVLKRALNQCNMF